jgi:hypothetical protein
MYHHTWSNFMYHLELFHAVSESYLLLNSSGSPLSIRAFHKRNMNVLRAHTRASDPSRNFPHSREKTQCPQARCREYWRIIATRRVACWRDIASSFFTRDQPGSEEKQNVLALLHPHEVFQKSVLITLGGFGVTNQTKSFGGKREKAALLYWTSFLMKLSLPLSKVSIYMHMSV